MSGAWSNDQLRELVLPPDASSASARIVIGPDVPADLSATYAGFGEDVVAALVFYVDGDNYIYLACLDTPPGLAIGARSTLGVHEAAFIWDRTGNPRIDFGGFAGTILASNSAGWVDGLFAIQPSTSATQETWHTPTLLAGWAQQGGGFATLQYRLVPSPASAVQLSGCISGGTTVDGTTVFTLPLGYRPSSTHVVVNVPSGRLTIDSSGNVKTAGLTSAFIQLEAVIDISR